MNEWEKEFNKVLPCINKGCDSKGVIRESEDDLEQCQYCHEVRFPVKSFIQAQIDKAKSEVIDKIWENAEVKYIDNTNHYCSVDMLRKLI